MTMTSAAATQTTPINESLGGLWQAFKKLVTPAFRSSERESHQMLVFLEFEENMYLVPAARSIQRWQLFFNKQQCLLRVAESVHKFQLDDASRIYLGCTKARCDEQVVHMHAMLIRLHWLQANSKTLRAQLKNWVCKESTLMDPVMAELYARARQMA